LKLWPLQPDHPNWELVSKFIIALALPPGPGTRYYANTPEEVREFMARVRKE
jgi:hypothetical protein